VMELVEGQPITEYCEEQRVSLRQRIELFNKVCQGVHHAHQKGVVHRDLKPSNVLVAQVGDEHVPKLIDFGIARALEGEGSGLELTETGMMLGTPAYMAPEQARGDLGAIDTRTDVYALGAMLYELLTGVQPLSGELTAAASPWDLRQRILQAETPKPSARVAPGGRQESTWQRLLRQDLDWIVLKAMSKEPERRYGSAAELAADLQRYLQQEPVLAGPPSAGYRLRKFVRRYRLQVTAAAAVLVTAILGAVLVVNYAVIAGDLAASEGLARAEAQRTVADFNQLSADVRLRDALTKQEALWPAWPDKVEALQAWLANDCAPLLDQKPQIEATIAELRRRAMPLTAEQVMADRRAAAEWPQFERQQQLVASLRRAQEIRSGAAKLELPELPATLRDADAPALSLFVWPRVAPEQPGGGKPERAIFGEEAIALVAARVAVARAAGKEDEFRCLDTLAWAALANGQDQEAKQCTAESLVKAPARQRNDHVGHQRAIEAAIIESVARLATAERKLSTLDAKVSERRTWTFGTDAESESARFLHDALVAVMAGINSMATKEKLDVEQRLAWAQQVRPASLAHPKARVTWDAARESIAKADDVVASKLYAGISIPLPDDEVIGLVPIGMNPKTKLWEFYDLRSAWNGKQPTSEIEIPRHKENGSIEVQDSTGIVLVLLPGGRVTLGSQQDDAGAPFYDRKREKDEALHEVTLSPFLLARHELTQGQWARLWTWNREQRAPSFYSWENPLIGKKNKKTHPVESVDRAMCELLVTRHGMTLPSEAQWEYACRGGTTTPWSVEFSDLRKAANIADAEVGRKMPQWGAFETWSDDHLVHAPVGSFEANGFGLFDMHGNVSEWCRDQYSAYGSERGGDGVRPDSANPSTVRVNRGGGFSSAAVITRSASRDISSPSVRDHSVGVRPARLLEN
jgi:formylglycine-generating enzyme required for sulfatase activity